MSTEPEFQAHYQCHVCGELRYHNDVSTVDDKPICKEGDCKDAYYRITRPQPRDFGYYNGG